VAPPRMEADTVPRITCDHQNGCLSSRGGCPNRWHSLVSCDHGDSTASGLTHLLQAHDAVLPPHPLCVAQSAYGCG
jgi:hypothetical protein